MRVLVACEESQRVTIAFRNRGHEAYSCDILPCSGGYPEWHFHGDIRNWLWPYNAWDLVIAHPPCTRLANSGVRWLKERDLWDELKQAAAFFNLFTDIYLGSNKKTKVAIENPIPHKYAEIPRYDQIIQPYQFGHLEKKATCLWLYGLPPLQPTNDVEEEMKKLPYKERAKVHYASPGPQRAILRSKTYPGIAEAMAEQWSNTN